MTCNAFFAPPIATWPSYEVIFLVVGPSRSFGGPVCALDLEHMTPNQTSVRGHRNDPLSARLAVGGAILTARQEFRALGADYSLGGPLATTDYEGWACAERRIQVDGERDWRMGVRLRPRASGERPNEAKSG